MSHSGQSRCGRMGWIDNQSGRADLRHTNKEKTKNRKSESPASIVRYAYSVYQGTAKYFCKERQKYFASVPLTDWIFAVPLRSRQRGTEKNILFPTAVRFILQQNRLHWYGGVL